MTIIKTSQKQFCIHKAAIICATIHGTACMYTKLFFRCYTVFHKPYHNCLIEVSLIANQVIISNNYLDKMYSTM